MFIGPKGQDVLRSYLLRDAGAFCFVPAEGRGGYAGQAARQP